MDEINRKLDALVKSVGEVQASNLKIEERVITLETGQSVGRTEAPSSTVTADHVEVSDNRGPTGLHKGWAKVHDEFAVIKDALQRVKLPDDLKVDESRTGIQRKDQPRLNVLHRCAKTAETTLKLLSTLKPDITPVTEADLQDLVAIQVSQIRLLQEEHALLMVTSTFGEGVEKLYKGFQRRNIDVDALQASVTLNNQMEANSSRSRGRGRGGFNSFSGRGGYGRGRSSYHDSFGSFNNNYSQQLSGRIPANRYQGNTHGDSTAQNFD